MHPVLTSPWRLLTYLGIWLPFGLGLALTVGTLGPLPLATAALLALPPTYAHAFACLSAYWLCRAAPLRGATLLRAVLSQAAAAALTATLVYAAVLALAGLAEAQGDAPGAADTVIRLAPSLLTPLLLAYLLSATVHYALLAAEERRRAEAEALQADVLAREAELTALRGQVHPHFLFNALNSISALVVRDPNEARRLCGLLADFLRTTLTLGAADRVPLEEEARLAERLLSIEQVRFGSRLQFSLEVEEATRGLRVPPLVLLPLVENAVTHGVASLLDGGAVEVAARRRGSHLEFSVANPFDPGTRRKGAGTGLANLRKRLAALYRDAATVKAEAHGERFEVVVLLPAEELRAPGQAS